MAASSRAPQRTRLAFLALTLLAPAMAASCGDDPAATDSANLTECKTPAVGHKRVFRNVELSKPVGMVQAPGDDDHFYVFEHTGIVKRLTPNDSELANAEVEVFVDLSDRVHEDWEAGLNGMAFHPSRNEVFFSYNPFVDVKKREGFGWRLSRFQIANGKVSVASEEIVLEITKEGNGRNRDHNAGDIHFGADGLLYVAVGDGGAQHDPNGNARNTFDRRGKVLRIDVDNPDEGQKFGTPANNPFASGEKGLKEVFAHGLRNPWRFSFDKQNGDLWIGDSGQNGMEDIELIPKKDFGKPSFHGWPNFEGLKCHGAGGPGSPEFAAKCKNLEKGRSPAWSFHHKPDAADPNAAPPPYVASLIGGYVYRGSEIPGLEGTYVFADYSNGKVYGLYPNPNKNKALCNGASRCPLEADRLSGKVSSFAEDNQGEIYVLSFSKNQIFKLTRGSKCAAAPEKVASYAFLVQDGAGNEKEALEYYDKIGARSGAEAAPDLGTWLATNIGDLPVRRAYYQNVADLGGPEGTGFYREMSCSEAVKRPKVRVEDGKVVEVLERGGGCWVRNWQNEKDKDDPNAADRGTVTMNLSAEGFVRFYVFAPPAKKDIGEGHAVDGLYPSNSEAKLSTKAVLDSEGEKFVPQLCTPCHGGQYAGDGDLGSIFREFEPDNFKTISTVDQAAADLAWFELNKSARSANESSWSEAEGAVEGTDKSKEHILEYIGAIFDESSGTPVKKDILDPSHMPDSWKGDQSSLYQETKEATWPIVNKYCMTCHRAGNTFDFADFRVLEDFAVSETLLAMVLENKLDKQRALVPFMPQTELLSRRIRANEDNALDILEGFVIEAQNPDVAQCQVSFLIKDDLRFGQQKLTQAEWTLRLLGDDKNIFGEVWNPLLGGLTLEDSTEELAQLGTLIDDGQGKKIAVNPAQIRVWTATQTVAQGSAFQYKATVYDNEGNHIQWEAGENRGVVVPTGGAACKVTEEHFFRKF